jgi:hypothetical protein
MADKDHDRLWKIRYLYGMLSKTYAKLYNPSEHLAVKKLLCYSKRELLSSETFLQNINALI